MNSVTEERARVEIVPPHKHYYTMEMEDEPECVNKALNFGSRLMGGKAMVRLGGLDNNEEKLVKIESLVLAACGTSHYATRYVEVLLRKLGCFNYIECKIASEITDFDL